MTKLVGVDKAVKVYAKVDRRLTRERQGIFRAAARKTLVPPMKMLAQRSPGKAGPALARVVMARNGRRGAVLVGPKGGKRGAWFRHFFIDGAKPHVIGAPRAAELRRYTSTSRQYRNTGGYFYRRVKARNRKFLFNPNAPFLALGPVRHPGFNSNDFVDDAWDLAGSSAFVEEVKARLYFDRDQEGNRR